MTARPEVTKRRIRRTLYLLGCLAAIVFWALHGVFTAVQAPYVGF
jgi:hypothetical protein